MSSDSFDPSDIFDPSALFNLTYKKGPCLPGRLHGPFRSVIIRNPAEVRVPGFHMMGEEKIQKQGPPRYVAVQDWGSLKIFVVKSQNFSRLFEVIPRRRDWVLMKPKKN